MHDYEDTQNEPDIPSSINVHPFHGGDTQQACQYTYLYPAVLLIFIEQWLIHDDGKGGAALMSKHNNKYVVPNNGGITSRDAPYFWKISEDGRGYRSVIRVGSLYQTFSNPYPVGSIGMKSPGSNLCLCLVNNTAKLGGSLEVDCEPIFILRSTPENYAAIQKSQFMTPPDLTAQLAGNADIISRIPHADESEL